MRASTCRHGLCFIGIVTNVLGQVCLPRLPLKTNDITDDSLKIRLRPSSIGCVLLPVCLPIGLPAAAFHPYADAVPLNVTLHADGTADFSWVYDKDASGASW